MSFDAAIFVNEVSKSFKVFQSPQDRLKQGLFGSKKKYFEEFWALRNINLEIQEGETVGIIGRNGSGKSTLLQIIAGTLTPSSGEVKVNGRVAALLELGSGFNPEFTGRQNVYFNGAILGLSKEQIDSLIDEIERFADIGDFIDQPVKTYSSGMSVRLAFAVQAMVPKEILIVDEALAVGDELFQRKCFAKIEEFKKQGGTILFVSHSGGTIIELCDRAVLLDEGKTLIIGQSKRVVNIYQKLIYAPRERLEAVREEISSIVSSQYSREADEMSIELDSVMNKETGELDLRIEYDENLVPRETMRYEFNGAEIFDSQITDLKGQRANLLTSGRPYVWSYRVIFHQDCRNVRFGMLIKTATGFDLAGYVTARPFSGLPIVRAGHVCEVQFKFTPNFNQGIYFFNAGVIAEVNGEEEYVDRLVDVTAFKIMRNKDALSTSVVDVGVHVEVFEKV